MSTDLDEFAVQFPCPFCGAEPGEWCVTARPYYRQPGRRASWLHEGRLRPVRGAYMHGVSDGRRWASEHFVRVRDTGTERDREWLDAALARWLVGDW